MFKADILGLHAALEVSEIQAAAGMFHRDGAALHSLRLPLGCVTLQVTVQL